MSKLEIESSFPQLSESGYKITSPATPEYNCIAWAADDDEIWWWPDPLDTSYWPPTAPRVETVEAFLLAYATIGYKKCDNSEKEEGFEKVALYTNAAGKPEHAAKQLKSGYWTSKLGQFEDIEHKLLDGLHGRTYGSATVFMKRPLKSGTER